MVSFVLSIVCGALVLALDIFTKQLITANFALGESAELLNGFVNLIYVHNTGGAWGILSESTWILTAVSAAVMAICLYILFKYARQSKLLHWAMSLVIFGGMGNLLDRVFRNGNVVDFLHFEFWDSFPVFNVADCAVVVGAGLLILYFIADTVRERKLKSLHGEKADEDC